MQLSRAWLYGLPRGDGPVSADAVVVPPIYPDTPTVRRTLARHYRNIEQMDRQVGEILDRLDAEGLADSTIVIWTTDHGDGLPRAKRDLTDGGLHVPLIVRWPDRLRPPRYAPGSTDDRLVSFVDLAPAVLGLAGLAPPDFVQGVDFLDPVEPPREFVFATRDRMDDFVDRERAVRSRRYKYVWSASPDTPNGHPLDFRDHLDMVREMRALHEAGELDAVQRAWFEPTGRERLYDLESDPHETRDLSASPVHAEVLARMRTALASWQARVPDWGEEPEDAMVERMWPGGVQPETAAPEMAWRDGRVALSCPTPGASIEVRVDDGPWRAYAAPIDAPHATITARAVRYGYRESAEATSTAP
jgi:arylsulfatase A-like enzyme